MRGMWSSGTRGRATARENTGVGPRDVQATARGNCQATSSLDRGDRGKKGAGRLEARLHTGPKWGGEGDAGDQGLQSGSLWFVTVPEVSLGPGEFFRHPLWLGFVLQSPCNPGRAPLLNARATTLCSLLP